jgi:hypothetical protein
MYYGRQCFVFFLCVVVILYCAVASVFYIQHTDACKLRLPREVTCFTSLTRDMDKLDE